MTNRNTMTHQPSLFHHT